MRMPGISATCTTMSVPIWPGAGEPDRDGPVQLRALDAALPRIAGWDMTPFLPK